MSNEDEILDRADEVFKGHKISSPEGPRMRRKHTREKKEKNKSKFKTFLKIYVAILVVLMIIALIYVFNSLKKYENNQIDNYMKHTISELTKACEKGKIEEYVSKDDFKLSEFEKDSTTLNDGIGSILKEKNITYKRTDTNLNDEKQVYTLYADEKPILDVHLDGTAKETRLSILTFSKWKIEKVTNNSEDGFYTCKVSAPSNCKVFVNGKELGKDNVLSEDKEDVLEEVSKYASIAYQIKYEVKGLITKPEVKIFDSKNKEQEYTVDEKTGEIVKDLGYKKIKSYEEAMKKIKGNVNIKQIAENWSLFLTDDLAGRLHGFYNMKTYIVDGSTMYKNAYKWATGVDVTFISRHVLLNPRFSNEKISNFEIYNDKAFSCEVYLIKNLRVVGMRNNTVKDKLHERFYFVYYDDTKDGVDNPRWKLVNMRSVAEK